MKISTRLFSQHIEQNKKYSKTLLLCLCFFGRLTNQHVLKKLRYLELRDFEQKNNRSIEPYEKSRWFLVLKEKFVDV